MDQKKGLYLASRACMKCGHFGVSQNFRTQFVRTRPIVPTPDPAGHCLVSTHQYFCKVVAVIFIVIARWLDPTYPSYSFRRGQKVQCDQWKEPSFQCLHKVTTKYFQPLAITRTHSTWNILTSKHLLQSFQGEDYTLHKPEAIDIADGFCQNTVAPAESWGKHGRFSDLQIKVACSVT